MKQHKTSLTNAQSVNLLFRSSKVGNFKSNIHCPFDLYFLITRMCIHGHTHESWLLETSHPKEGSSGVLRSARGTCFCRDSAQDSVSPLQRRHRNPERSRNCGRQHAEDAENVVEWLYVDYIILRVVKMVFFGNGVLTPAKQVVWTKNGENSSHKQKKEKHTIFRHPQRRSQIRHRSCQRLRDQC